MPTALLLAACLTDIMYKKVLNWFVVAGFFCVLASHLIFGNQEVLLEASFGLGLALTLALPLYLIKGLGGGDLKIFAVFGFATHPSAVLFTFLAALVWGCILGILRAVFEKKGQALFNNFYKIITLKRPEPQTLHKIPFTVALLAGWFSFLIYEAYGRVL